MEGYSLHIKGEHTLYSFEEWSDMSADTLCLVLSDLTGYKAEFLRNEALPQRFNHLGYATVEPAAQGGWGGVPTFLIRSRSGGGMKPREEVKS